MCCHQTSKKEKKKRESMQLSPMRCYRTRKEIKKFVEDDEEKYFINKGNLILTFFYYISGDELLIAIGFPTATLPSAISFNIAVGAARRSPS
jgi:hypothetical protein